MAKGWSVPQPCQLSTCSSCAAAPADATAAAATAKARRRETAVAARRFRSLMSPCPPLFCWPRRFVAASSAPPRRGASGRYRPAPTIGQYTDRAAAGIRARRSAHVPRRRMTRATRSRPMSHGIPQTPFALLSGSAGWGIRFPDDLEEPGVPVVERGLAFDTPWGRTDNWQLLELAGRAAADGGPRRFLNVFSHGWPIDAIDHSAHRRVAWVLAQAGVRKVVADSTCGSLNKALRPRDFILPGDVIDFSQTQYSVLDGRFRHLCFANQMFCPALGGVVARIAQALWPSPGRVFGPDTRIVVAHNWGPRFTSRAEAGAYRQLGADALHHNIAPEAPTAHENSAPFF